MISATDVQRLLRAAGYYSGAIDGDIGPKTRSGIDRILSENAAALPPGWLSQARRRVAAVQLVLKAAGFETGPIDGYAGMLTKQALADWNEQQITGQKPAPWRSDDVPEDDDDRRGGRPGSGGSPGSDIDQLMKRGQEQLRERSFRQHAG